MIPLQKPLLPTQDKIASYLKQIDDKRYYSNVGFLVQEFEERLAALFKAPCITASSATSVLTATLIALDLPPKSLVACPSWTFIATPMAIMAAGHVPYFVDVCADGFINGQITVPSEVKAIVMVFPFGKISLDCNNLSIPVVVDAAAGFDVVSKYPRPSNVPVVISTHATKVFGTGEGGFVTCTDTDLLVKVRNVLNFGMNSNREVNLCGINGKMSEYHAAVGLASLDEWGEKRKQWVTALGYYTSLVGCSPSPVAVSSFSIQCDDAKETVQKLADRGVQAKHSWYGCHTHPIFSGIPRDPLPVTEELIKTTLHLPLFPDITVEQADYVWKAFQECSQ